MADMKNRKDCKCHCHKNGTNVKHVMACCYDFEDSVNDLRSCLENGDLHPRSDELKELAELAELILEDTAGKTESELADELIETVKSLCQKLAIPNMEGWGINKDEFYQAVDKMATDAIASGSPGNNPKVPTHAEIVALYKICFDYDFSAK